MGEAQFYQIYFGSNGEYTLFLSYKYPVEYIGKSVRITDKRGKFYLGLVNRIKNISREEFFVRQRSLDDLYYSMENLQFT